MTMIERFDQLMTAFLFEIEDKFFKNPHQNIEEIGIYMEREYNEIFETLNREYFKDRLNIDDIVMDQRYIYNYENNFGEHPYTIFVGDIKMNHEQFKQYLEDMYELPHIKHKIERIYDNN